MAADSRVNFHFLSKQEQVTRYRNMLTEYHSLRKSLEASMKEQPDREPCPPAPELAKSDRDLMRVRRKLAEGSFELDDCAVFVEELASALAGGALRTNTVEFALLNSLVGRVARRERQPAHPKLEGFFRVMSKGGLLEFFTGIPQNNASVSTHLSMQPTLPRGGGGRPANAVKGLNSAMLARFDSEHPGPLFRF